MSHSEVFIVSAARTPVGAFMGSLAELSATQLGAVAIRAAIERAAITPALVEQTYMGNVLSAGVGQAPARQAAIGAGVPVHAPAVTIGKVCGSGLEAVIAATRAIRLGDAELCIAGGMESMSQAPYLLPKARAGYRLGHGELVDSMILDGLWDPYGHFHMAEAAERCASELGIDRAAQDALATESYRRARGAHAAGLFREEIAAVTVTTRKGELRIDSDEEPQRGDPNKLAQLQPAFRADGTITAGNASKINDGAAALVLASAAAVQRHGLRPLARIVSYAHHAQEPESFPTAPGHAIDKALLRAGRSRDDVALYEINEAFAIVAIACMRLAQLDPARVNVRGGAVALGHPIGASGARILTTLLYALPKTSGSLGLATLCIGGGEANALLIERV
ncbi:MAG TPA: acetyl-CoA C-acyltransferase [Polyangiales bacterium]